MRPTCLPIATWLALTALASQPAAAAHGGTYGGGGKGPKTAGGTYAGPGDWVPGGAGRGVVGGPLAGTPSPTGPTSPGPSGPIGPGSPATGAGPGAPSTGAAGGLVSDSTSWQLWWRLNRAPYLDLKAHIHAHGVVTGSDDFYLGRGAMIEARDSLRPSQATVREQVVPALLRCLERERSHHIQSSALVALAKIGDAPGSGRRMSSVIGPFVTNGNQEVAETAAVALGILSSEADVELLVAMLEDDTRALQGLGLEVASSLSTRSRAFAAYGLGLIGHRTTNEDARRRINAACARQLAGRDRSPGAREIGVACITSIGLTPLALESGQGVTGSAELRSRSDQVAWLLELYQDDEADFVLRAHAPTALQRLSAGVRDPELRRRVAAPLLADLGQHSKAPHPLQQSCALALGGIGDCDEDELDMGIRATLMDVGRTVVDQQTRNFALIALGRIAGRAGSGEGDPLYAVSTRKKGESVRAHLAAQLTAGKPSTRAWAALALAILERSLSDSGRPASRELTQLLVEELRNARSPELVGALSIAAGIAREAGARDVLLENLEELRDDEARGYTAVALGLLGERAAIAPIQEIVDASRYRPELLQSAAIGLGLLGDKELVPELIDMLSNAGSLSAQTALSSALGFIGDARSIDPLIAMLEDTGKTDLARAFAAVALGIVADKEQLPWNSKVSCDVNYLANTETLLSQDQGTGLLDIL